MAGSDFFSEEPEVKRGDFCQRLRYKSRITNASFTDFEHRKEEEEEVESRGLCAKEAEISALQLQRFPLSKPPLVPSGGPI